MPNVNTITDSILPIKNRPEYDDNPPGKPKKYSNKQLKEALTFIEIFEIE